jgi:hypothetical protein
MAESEGFPAIKKDIIEYKILNVIYHTVLCFRYGF